MAFQSIWRGALIAVAFFASVVHADDDKPVPHLSEAKHKAVSGGFYEGVFSDGTPFQMNLALPSAALPAKLENGIRDEYWYPRRTEGGTLWLDVTTSAKSGEIVLSVAGKAKSSEPQEVFTGTRSKDDSEITGKWIDNKTHKELSFVMKRRFPYTTEYDTFVTPDAKTEYGGRTTELTATYPVTNMPVLDNEMPSVAVFTPRGHNTDDVVGGEDHEASEFATVTWASPDYVFLSKDDSDYNFGTPHGLGGTRYALYRVTGGVAKRLTLDDFLPPNSGCRAILSKKVVAALEKDDASQPELGALPPELGSSASRGDKATKSDDSTTQANTENYLVQPDGIEFYFGPYSMGPYTEIHYIFVSKASLGRCGSALPVYSAAK